MKVPPAVSRQNLAALLAALLLWPASSSLARDRDLLWPPGASDDNRKESGENPGAGNSATTPAAQGVLNAAVYGAPADLKRPVSLRLYDDMPATLYLQEKLTGLLRQQGMTVWASSAPLSLSFDISDESAGLPPERGSSSIVTLEGNDGSRREARYQAQLNVYSTATNSALANNAVLPSTNRARIRFQINLADAKEGRRLWEGWVIGPVINDSPEETAAAMAPAILRAMGKTVRNQPVDIRPEPHP